MTARCTTRRLRGLLPAAATAVATAAAATACSTAAVPAPAASAPAPPGFAAAAASPCTLVTTAEAEAILAHPLGPPQTGPQGTCVYLAPAAGSSPPRPARPAHPRTTPSDTPGSADQTGSTPVTVTLAEVPDADIAEAVLPTASAVTGLRRPAACGATGTGSQMLFVLLDSHHLLEVVAPTCDTATAFAARALTRL